MTNLKIKTILSVFLLAILLLLNIVYSQNISPLFFDFSNEEREPSALFLKNIKSLPEFNNLLSRFQRIFDPSFERLVFAEEKERTAEIEKLNTVLEKNSKARDVFYGLSLLYKEEGNKAKSEGYLKKAVEIDPGL